MDIESTFAKVFGRSPAEDERVFLRRLAGAWNVRGNEALLALLFVLQFGPGYQRYSARCAESVRRAVRFALHQSGRTATMGPGRRPVLPLGQSTALAALGWIAIIVTGLAGLSMGASSHFDELLGTAPVGSVTKVVAAVATASAGWTSLVVATPTACWVVVSWVQRRAARGCREPGE